MREVYHDENADEEAKYRKRGGGQAFQPWRRRGATVATTLLLVVLIGAAIVFGATDLFAAATEPATSLPRISGREYDAIIVPGGGLDATHAPAGWVIGRLDAALRHDVRTDSYLVLSRGTTHKPPPLDAEGFPVDEAMASARYLVSQGVDASRVLLESWSLDTIGNAAFARLMHADLRGWRRVLVVTSAFHMPRTRAIFDWVFSLPSLSGAARVVRIDYEEVTDSGMADEHLGSRQQKEAEALRALREKTIPSIKDLAKLHSFLFTHHGAYRAKASTERRETPPEALVKTY